MTRHVALLRGINVGGANSIKMQHLRAIFEQCGCLNTRTYIQSGNVVFDFTGNILKLASTLGRVMEDALSFRPEILIMTSTAFRTIATENPYANTDVEEKLRHVLFLAEPAQHADTEAIAALKSASEKYFITDSAFYLLAPEGIGRSKLVARVEKCLGVATTGRNVRTVNKILQLMDEQPD